MSDVETDASDPRSADDPTSGPLWPWAKQPLIYSKMAAVLAALPAVAKAKQNKDQGFAFRGIDDVINALAGALAEHGIFYLPRTLERLAEVRTTRSGASLWTVHLHVEFTFYAEDGSSVSASTWGEGVDMADKATSKAHTFAQKSCLVEAFNVATADLIDPDSSTPEESSPHDPDAWFKENGWVSKAQHDEWRAVAVTVLREHTDLREKFGAWREPHGIGAFVDGRHTKKQADLIDRFLDGDPSPPSTAKKTRRAPKKDATAEQEGEG